MEEVVIHRSTWHMGKMQAEYTRLWSTLGFEHPRAEAKLKQLGALIRAGQKDDWWKAGSEYQLLIAAAWH